MFGTLARIMTVLERPVGGGGATRGASKMSVTLLWIAPNILVDSRFWKKFENGYETTTQ